MVYKYILQSIEADFFLYLFSSRAKKHKITGKTWMPLTVNVNEKVSHVTMNF